MPTPNHPDDELLSALAGRDPDAGTDAALAGHIAACARCADLVAELGALRASLAELPDLAPSRPLRLVPPVGEAQPATDRLGGWVRRLFAPALALGGVMVMVGAVGTATPAMDGAGQSAQPDEAMEFEAAASPASGAGGEADGAGEERVLGASADPHDDAERGEADQNPTFDLSRDSNLSADRSPWPMVLFTGVAVVIGALLLRWILVPRAG
jgi:anti-sigma factor RsiW